MKLSVENKLLLNFTLALLFFSLFAFNTYNKMQQLIQLNYEKEKIELTAQHIDDIKNEIITSLVTLFVALLIIYLLFYFLLKKDLAWTRKTRKKIEDGLIESKARMQAILDNSSDAIWSVDTNICLMIFNNSFQKIQTSILPIEPYEGMSMLQHLDAESKTIWETAYQKALTGECFTQEIIDNKSEQELFFEVSFNPITINETITGVAVFASNVTTRKNLDQQLHYKVKELNTFMYKSTHDLRSPLVSVMGLIQLAKGCSKEPELIQYFNMIDTSVKKMDNLLIDLVKIVNVSQGKLSADEINFNTMVNEILTSLSHREEFADVIFKQHINIEGIFKSDSRLIYSVMQNLIDNALKYKYSKNNAASMIIITIDGNENQARIGITDNGIGIDADVQDKVFDMFYRATDKSTGTGLGLYIVKTTVEKLGGKIILNSIKKKGTSINITLPSLSSN